MGRGSEHRIGDACPAKALDLLLPAQLFDAKVGRIYRVRIDQNRGNARPSKHCGGGRARKSAANDRNVSIFHGWFPLPSPLITPGMANKTLPSRPALEQIRPVGMLSIN